MFSSGSREQTGRRFTRSSKAISFLDCDGKSLTSERVMRCLAADIAVVPSSFFSFVFKFTIFFFHAG